MEQTAKGSGFLKVTGILMIIGGAIGIIMGIVALATVGVAMNAVGASALIGLLIFAGILALAGSILELIAGIVGVKNCKNPEKATACLVWGIIVAAISVISCILTAVGGAAFPVGSFLLGLVLPVLYIIGAALNKKAA